MGIEFSELENELGNAYYAQVLYGSENGQRFWRLTFPTLTGSSMDNRTTTGVNGETLTYEEYLWDLFCEQKISGTPFAYQDLRTGGYYLVRFVDKRLTYQRMLTKLYSTGIELKQWRIPGETAYAPGLLSQTAAAYDPSTFPDFDGFWPAEPSTNSLLGSLEPTGDVTASTSGSLPIIRLNLTTNNALLSTPENFTVKEAFFLMKIREATFSSTGGILSGDVAPNNTFLVGDSGTTKFYNLSFGSPYTYKLDGVEYDETNQQAPMNTWGIVHARHTSGVALTNLQIGKDRDIAGRYAELDLAYVILSSETYPRSIVREIMEFLSILKAQL